MSLTSTTKYLGNLRTHSIHLKSGNDLITDAPIDNQGKGEAFSPTDLLATSLTTCMITIMGIVAKKNDLNIDNLEAKTTKIMSANPRMVIEIIIEFNFQKNDFNQEQQEILKQAALSCPVALSLSDNLKKTVKFNF